MYLTPMSPADVPAYLRGFVDWHAQAMLEAGVGIGAGADVDDLHARARAQLEPQLGPDGLPVGSTIFDVRTGDTEEKVGVLWAGGADFGFGPLFYVHDLRIHAPFRGRGFGREALDDVYEIAKARGGVVGVALSVLASNAVARELYRSSGFAVLSEVMVRRF
jgi:ribosomal protein S18 acetylase RimI-like enzyme